MRIIKIFDDFKNFTNSEINKSTIKTEYKHYSTLNGKLDLYLNNTAISNPNLSLNLVNFTNYEKEEILKYTKGKFLIFNSKNKLMSSLDDDYESNITLYNKSPMISNLVIKIAKSDDEYFYVNIVSD